MKQKKIQFDRVSVSTLPSLQLFFFIIEISQEIHFQICLPGSVLERHYQGLFKSVIERSCSYLQMSLNYKDTPNFKKIFGSQVQRPFSPSSKSERQGQKLLGDPRGIYQVIQKVLSNFHIKLT